MKFVYIVMSGEGNGKIVSVFSEKETATLAVDIYALNHFGIDINNINHAPLDFDGALMRYGWADKIWWQKEVVYW